MLRNHVLRLASAGLAGALLAARAPGQEAVPDTLARYQKTYDAELAKIDAEAARRTDALAQQYAKSLAQSEQAAQKEGALDRLLAIRKEKDRFGAGGRVEEGDVSADMPELRALQQGYLKAAGAAKLDRSRGVLSLERQLEESLRKLQTRLTQAGKVDDALLAKAKLEAVQKRPEVTEAQFALAEADAHIKAQEKPAAPAAQVETPPPAAPAEAAVGRGDEKQIKKRYMQYCDAIGAEDLEKAITFMDPRFVGLAGKDAIKPYLLKMVPYIKGAKTAGIDIDPGRVEFGPVVGEAKNFPRYWIGNRWEHGDPTYWVRVEGAWYVDCRDHKKDGDAAAPKK